jgi:hypothetical protein
MQATGIGQRIQAAFDWIRDVLEPIENRWIILSAVIFIYLILRAVGAHGVGEIITVVYIMYWVTLRGPERERD